MALAKRIIPCLDCDNGRVVKGVKFVNIRDAGDPVEVAKRYCDAGADEITFLDISASHEGRDTTIHTVKAIAGEVFIPLTVGGGIRNLEDIRTILGADTLGYLSVEGLLEVVGGTKGGFCDACFTGNYPVPVQLELSKLALEQPGPAAD